MTVVPIILDMNYLRGTRIRRRIFTHLYGKAMREEGFVCVENHAVTPHMIREAYDLMGMFFALPPDIKARYHLPLFRGQRGYTPFCVERYDGKDSELKEHWSWGMSTDHPLFPEPLPDIMPNDMIPEFGPFFRELFRILRAHWIELRRALAESVALTDFVTASGEVDDSLLRLLRYPPLSELPARNGFRSCAHVDTGFLTLLVAPNARGLQLKVNNGRDGFWQSMPVDPDLLITNGGKLLHRIAPVFPPRWHRVIVVAGDEERERLAMAFFGWPAADEVVMPIPKLYRAARQKELPMPQMTWEFLGEDLAKHKM